MPLWKGPLVGSRKQYADLTSIHVSADARGHGLGRRLFLLAEDTARQLGAEALYISAHSAVESQAFYKAMGCVEAAEYLPPMWSRSLRLPVGAQGVGGGVKKQNRNKTEFFRVCRERCGTPFFVPAQ